MDRGGGEHPGQLGLAETWRCAFASVASSAFVLGVGGACLLLSSRVTPLPRRRASIATEGFACARPCPAAGARAAAEPKAGERSERLGVVEEGRPVHSGASRGVSWAFG